MPRSFTPSSLHSAPVWRGFTRPAHRGLRLSSSRLSSGFSSAHSLSASFGRAELPLSSCLCSSSSYSYTHGLSCDQAQAPFCPLSLRAFCYVALDAYFNITLSARWRRRRSNQAMERTADRCTLHFEMTSTFPLEPTRAPIRRRSPCSREMLTRTVILLLGVLGAHSAAAADPLQGTICVADGTANLALVAKVNDARTRKPLSDATVTAIRTGRGTTLLASDSRAMPPPQKTDRRGCSVLHAHFRSAGGPSGYSVFVAQSFLRVQAPGFRSTDVRISAIGRLDFARKTKNPGVTIPVALGHE
jgi:hypothetical protein